MASENPQDGQKTTFEYTITFDCLAAVNRAGRPEAAGGRSQKEKTNEGMVKIKQPLIERN